jgi:hypothetical protein
MLLQEEDNDSNAVVAESAVGQDCLPPHHAAHTFHATVTGMSNNHRQILAFF